MRRLVSNPRSLVGLMLALSLGAGSAGAVGNAAAAAPPGSDAPAAGVATAHFTRTAQWTTGYVGNVTIRNGTTAARDGWRVEFDLPADTRITTLYNGQLSRTGNRYTVTNMTWNGALAPGMSATFGWVAYGSGTPTNCTLDGGPCDGVPLDYTAPARPADLRIDRSNGVTLRWGPSTDDQGPVRYEVYESGRLLTTTTDTSYVFRVGPTLPPRIYVFWVQAVDAAGNRSARSYVTLGYPWPNDQPAPPSDLRVDTSTAELLRLRWTPSPIVPGTGLPPAPIAGYEVYLDGVLLGQVWDTSFTMAAPSPGAYTFAVRSFNAIDRYSPLVQLHHVVAG